MIELKCQHCGETFVAKLARANIIGPEAALESHLTTFGDVVTKRHASL